MKNTTTSLSFLFGLLGFCALQATPEYLEPSKPYSSSAFFQNQAIQSVDLSRGRLQVPLITWAADGITIDANGGMTPQAGSRLAKAVGLPVELKVVDEFDQQVKDYLTGKSPFLRGTVGMVTLASEALKAKDPSLEPVVIFQHSWSTGADGFVAKGIDTLTDLKGKSIVVQKNGPHLDLVQVLLQDAGLKANDVTIKYVADITAIEEGVTRDPAGAFRADSSLSGAACIYPDILTLTAGGTVGTGAEDSIKGARPILTTRTASRVVADVYAVRKDFFEQNRELVHGFVLELIKTQTEFQNELSNIKKKSQANKDQLSAFRKRCRPLAAFALQDEEAVNDYIAWLGLDSELAGYEGNVDFFANPRNPIGFSATAKRAATYFQSVAFLETTTTPTTAQWDYNSDFKAFLSGAAVTKAPKKKTFSTPQAVAKAVSTDGSSELFRYTFQFPANIAEIEWQDHREVFDSLHDTSSRYGGAVIQLRGHADNFFSNFVSMKRQQGETTYRQRQAGTNQFIEKPLPKLEQIIGSANRLSYNRAFSVKKAYAQYLREGLSLTPDEIDLSRLDVKGMGVNDPVYPNPSSKEERAENMRGELVIFAVESEISLDFGMDDLK